MACDDERVAQDDTLNLVILGSTTTMCVLTFFVLLYFLWKLRN